MSSRRQREQWNEGAVQVVGTPPHRKVVAKRALQRGEVILRETPTCTVLHAKQWGERCNYCFGKSITDKLLRCSRCKRFWYCSKECQRNDWKEWHKDECQALATVSTEDEDALLVDALLVARIFALEEKDPQRYNAVVDLVFHNMCIQPLHYQVAKLASTMGLLKLRKRKITQQEIVEILARFDSNNFGIVDPLLFLQGTGVYPNGAMLNHSCDHNCAISYEPACHTQIIRCIVDNVQPGEELCHPYIDLAMMSAQARRQKLCNTYGFDCQCARCLDTDGKWRQVDTWLSSPAPGVTEAQAERVIADSQVLLQQAALEQDLDEELRLVLQSVAQRAKVLHARHWSLYQARSQLHTTAMAAGELAMAREQCVDIVETMGSCFYKPQHPLMGIMLYTLGSLHHSLEEFLQAIQCYEKALPVLSSYHGQNHSLVAGCRDYLEQARSQGRTNV